MAALVAGLNSPPIRRLKRTWEQVSRQSKSVLADAERTMDTNKNFANYRTILKSARLPCVPFFGEPERTFALDSPYQIYETRTDFFIRRLSERLDIHPGWEQEYDTGRHYQL